MARVRPAAYAALLLVLLVAATASAAIPRSVDAPLAVVAWPPSASLVIAEVVTGGASASDEYVEVANAGSSPADLAGLEVAYATSSGATVTKKAAWTASLTLAPGQHLLLANGSGAYAPIADAVYTTGLAATGGAIVLRQTGGAVIDAVGWGDATNAFVEGSPASAPPAGQSIERLPGGGDNTVDTNSNSADFRVSSAPVPQNLAAAPVPSPSPSPSPTSSASADPSPEPTASATPGPGSSAAPTATPSIEPSPAASETPAPSPAPSTTPEPTAEPTATVTPPPPPTPSESPAPTPTPTPSPLPSVSESPLPSTSEPPLPTATAGPSPLPTGSGSATPTPTATLVPDPTMAPSVTPDPTVTPSPTPEPTPEPLAIAAARALPDGATVTIEGALTTGLGALEAGRTGFVQDPSGGIALYLDAAYGAPIPAGTWVRATGTLASRYGQRTLRVAGADVAIVAVAGLPAPLDVSTGAAGEPLEGVRLHVSGVVTVAPTTLADGIAFDIDDGSGALRLVVAPAALGGATVTAGMLVTAIGPLGQRDSSGTGIGGYRIFATLPGELTAEPAATPTPPLTASPSPTVVPTPSETVEPTASATPSSPEPTAAPSLMPSASPSPTPSVGPTATPPLALPLLTVGQARSVPVGATARVTGVVTAEAGRLGTPSLFVIGDVSGGLPVRLADGMTAPSRGTLVEATGVIAEPYGQTELRLVSGGLISLGTMAPPSPEPVPARTVDESVEGRLVAVSGVISTGATKSTSGDIVLVLTGADGATLRAYADASARLSSSALAKGLTVTLTGIAGQHASRKGALDGYRIWLRDARDVVRTSAAGSSPDVSPTPSASPTGGLPATQSIATARVRDGATVTVEGVVTADRSLLDGTGRLTVIEDSTAAMELCLAASDPRIRLGARVRVSGVVARAWGAPRLRAEKVTLLGVATPTVLDLRVAPTAATEWRLVRVSGTVTSVHRAGDRWVAELDAGTGGTIPIIALTGAGIPADAIAAGHRATIVGIVKRPYPTASDRRYAVLPRRATDVTLGALVAASPQPSGSAPVAGASGPASGGQSPGSDGQGADAPATDIRDLASRIGQRVRIGGIVTEATSGGFRLDDGTATARVALEANAVTLSAVLAPGDGLDATGIVEDRDGPVVVVRDASDIVLVGDLGDEAAASSSPVAARVIVIGSAAPTLAVVSGASKAPAPGLEAVVAVLAIIAAAAALGTRRLRDRRRLRTRLERRLAALAGGAAGPWSSRSEPGAAAPATSVGVADG